MRASKRSQQSGHAIAVGGAMSKATERYIIGAVQPKNVLGYPANAVSRIWEDELLPLKAALTGSYGVGLFGLLVKHHFDTTSHRDFEVICRDNGLFPPLNPKTRIIVSDQGFQKAPALKNDDHLLLAINANDASSESWAPLSGRPEVLEIHSNLAELHSHIRDVLLDISFANTYWGRTHTRAALKVVSDRRSFYREKVAAVGGSKYVTKDAPYVSYSRVARDPKSPSGRGDSTPVLFGTSSHIEAFVTRWDKFLLNLLSRCEDPRKVATDMICSYPKIGGMMSRRSVRRLIGELPAGPHVLVIERRSTKMRTSPKFRHEAQAAFSSLPILGAGGKMWGICPGGKLPPALSLLVEKKAVYAIRVLIGR